MAALMKKNKIKANIGIYKAEICVSTVQKKNRKRRSDSLNDRRQKDIKRETERGRLDGDILDI